MTILIIFLTAYVVTCGWFFAKLVRWTLDCERGCSCRGALDSGTAAILHGRKTCYPMAEALGAH
jgi:hypothetical protein